MIIIIVVVVFVVVYSATNRNEFQKQKNNVEKSATDCEPIVYTMLDSQHLTTL
jgi:hypothetical protein